jgi:2-C-methyl-D-erythritol 4-phosphate cytidylyltransferase
MKRVAVILPAAGKSVRMGLKTPKPFLPLEGVPMLARSIEAFQECRGVDLIQPVLPKAHLSRFRERLLKKYSWPKCSPAVPGGRERQDSVLRGLEALPDEVEIVVVHDAARPLVSASLINRVLDAAESTGAALAALPVHDTVKRASAGMYVGKTVERRGLWLAQTPQAFRRSLLREAYDRAAASGLRGTDEAYLVEAIDHPVCLVPGSALNLKVTTREDLSLARLILRSRGV